MGFDLSNSPCGVEKGVKRVCVKKVIKKIFQI